MKSIYFESIPPDIETLKSNAADKVTVVGAAIYGTEVFNALLRHSTYDRIFLPAPPPGKAPIAISDSTLPSKHRIVRLAEHQFIEMREAEHLVMASPGSSFFNLMRARRIAGRPHTPITAVIHSIHYASQLHAILALYLSPLKCFDALICSSTAGHRAMQNFAKTVAAELERCGLGNLTVPVKMPVIPLGVNTQGFTRIENCSMRERLGAGEQPLILYFGRFSPTSKADLGPLITAFADLIQRRTAILVLAGDDTHYGMAAELMAFAAELGCAEHLRVLSNPTTREKHELYSAADIFVSPADSIQETFGISVVEAMAASLPVVASDWNGYKDLVVHGETGYLVRTTMPLYTRRFDDLRGSGAMKTADLLAATTILDLRSLIESLEKLVADPEHRRTLGEAGRRRAVSLYDWSVVIRQYEQLWEQLSEEAALAQCATSSNRLDLTQWCYSEIFDHYPTGFLDAETSLAISPRGRGWLQRPQLLKTIAAPESWFKPDLLRCFLDVLSSTGEQSVAQLLGNSRSGDTILPLSHLCRLLKYGLVEPAQRERNSTGIS